MIATDTLLSPLMGVDFFLCRCPLMPKQKLADDNHADNKEPLHQIRKRLARIEQGNDIRISNDHFTATLPRIAAPI